MYIKVSLSKWCKIQHFKILFIFSIYSFIFNICIYSALLFVQNSTPIFIFNSSICSQNYYPFRNYPFNNILFIQDLLRISLTHGSDVLPAVDEQGVAKKRKRSLELWKDTDPKAPLIRTFKTLPDYSPTMFHWFSANIFCELQTREKCKEVLYTIRKLNGVSNPPTGKGGSCSSPVCGQLLFQTNF